MTALVSAEVLQAWYSSFLMFCQKAPKTSTAWVVGPFIHSCLDVSRVYSLYLLGLFFHTLCQGCQLFCLLLLLYYLAQEIPYTFSYHTAPLYGQNEFLGNMIFIVEFVKSITTFSSFRVSLPIIKSFWSPLLVLAYLPCQEESWSFGNFVDANTHCPWGVFHTALNWKYWMLSIAFLSLIIGLAMATVAWTPCWPWAWDFISSPGSVYCL